MDLSDPAVVTAVVVAVVALVVVALVVALLRRKKAESGRREHLQERFGSEYDRTVESSGDPRLAQARLQQVEERREQLRITPLTAASRQRRINQWQAVQADFVEVPVEAVDSADRLVSDVMAERGYPSGDSDERMQLLATDHADTVEHYRTAEAHKARFHSGEGSTEDLRRAFVEYRRLFDVLVEDTATDHAGTDDTGTDHTVTGHAVSGHTATDDTPTAGTASGSDAGRSGTDPRPDTRPEAVATPVRPEDDEPRDLSGRGRGSSSAHLADGDEDAERR